MNVITITGRLGRDPELKTAESGKEYCKFSVAVDRRKIKDKEVQTDWFECAAFGQQAVFISTYFHKGDGIEVVGRMEMSKKDDKTYWTLIVENPSFGHGSPKGKTEKKDDAHQGFNEINPDEVPF